VPSVKNSSTTFGAPGGSTSSFNTVILRTGSGEPSSINAYFPALYAAAVTA